MIRRSRGLVASFAPHGRERADALLLLLLLLLSLLLLPRLQLLPFFSMPTPGIRLWSVLLVLLVSFVARACAREACDMPQFHPPPPFDGQLNCTELVKANGISPKRSPQAVHSFLSAVFRGRDVVEVGSQIGEGMQCWARTARNATGVEYDHRYCMQWRQPAGTSARLICRSFYDGETPDADIYTWWQQHPLTTHRTLAHLAKLLRAGRIRSTAEAVFLSECGWAPDEESLREVAEIVTWAARVPFDERQHCLTHATRTSRHLCTRARGVFYVASVPIRAIPHRMAAD